MGDGVEGAGSGRCSAYDTRSVGAYREKRLGLAGATEKLSQENQFDGEAKENGQLRNIVA
jgi:hypothetical protein